MSKAVVIAFTKVKRTRRKIITTYKKGDDDFNVGSTENALPEFQQTMDALLPLFIRRAGFPEAYAENARVSEVHWTEQAGARKIMGVILKHLPERAGPVTIKTAWDFLETPTETGTYNPPLNAEDAALCEAFNDAARDYVIGKRAQGELPGIGLVKDDEDEDEKEGGGELADDKQGKLPVGEPGSEDGPPAGEGGKKKRGPKKKGGDVEKFPGHGDAHP